MLPALTDSGAALSVTSSAALTPLLSEVRPKAASHRFTVQGYLCEKLTSHLNYISFQRNKKKAQNQDNRCSCQA